MAKKRPRTTRRIHKQRSSHDCGVAALASYLDMPYEHVFVAAAAKSKTFLNGDGLTIPDMIGMAKAFGKDLRRVHYKRVDLSKHVGILGVNWEREDWEERGGSGHWVLLRHGTIIDPEGPSYSAAADYLRIRRGRAGTLLQEV